MEDIHPIKPIIQPPIFTDTQIIIFWIIISLLFCILAYFIIKKYFPKKTNPKITITTIDFKEQALQKMQQAQKYIELNNLKKFHLNVTDIIKEYAYKQHQINFPKMTTKEIISQFNFKIEKDKFKDFLKQCDLVKFANDKVNCKAKEDPLGEESKKELAQNIYKRGIEIIHKI